MVIRTKIVATVGPACQSRRRLAELVEAGVDVFRVNFSHGSNEQHGEFVENIRAVEAQAGQPLAVLADLCGPKIRVGPIAGGGVLLAEGQELVIQREPVEGDATRVSTTLPELIDAAEVGENILMDDGKIRLQVSRIEAPERIVCRVVVGGVLASGKGINLPRTALGVSALTEKDRRDVAWIAGREVDYVALSFVRSPADIDQLRELLAEHGSGAHVIAKIEKPQALQKIMQIIDAADGVMVARGDLGVEMDLPAVPVAQKRIARLCQAAGKCCIIATQMLETMTQSPVPTRAEVSDVANAVLDHTDAVMLSGETAVGKFPVAAVRMMDSIVRQVQSYYDETAEPVRVHSGAARTATALAAAVREVLTLEEIAAVAVYTGGGTTARMLAKSRLPCPILAMSQDIGTVRRMCLYYGVLARQADAPEHTRDVLALAERFAREADVATDGDRIVVISGRPIGEAGAVNTLVVHRVGDADSP